jgi:4-hydroxythreonine-4-phosphate dehydrogenase
MGTAKDPLRIAMSAGDPFGVGPELCRKALEACDCELRIFGDPAQFPDVPAGQLVAVPVEGDAPDRPGPSAAGGDASIRALQAALESIRDGECGALVTAPISKESWGLAGGAIDGHTPYLGAFFEAEPLMTFVWDETEPLVALLTTHIPLRAVPATLTSARVERAVRIVDEALRTRFAREKPLIGVLGLNPHAGEAGLLGTEEIDFVSPAIERLAEGGVRVEGPLPGDTAFAIRHRFDALLALYHDQGLAPVKALAFESAVNLTLGLPVIRTSPCHGTAFDLAGTGRADPSSMLAAVEWAARLTR